MKLLNLALKNFKGVRDFELKAQGRNAEILGDNATGKTTLFDAFSWLLFDKDSQGKKDFAIKTLDQNNQAIHGLQHEVEGVLEVDGKPLTLKKVYAEQWTKKRGSATATFTGHTTDYFIDGVPVKKNEYTARIAEIADENIFKLLTSPTYFNEQLHWTDRRKALLEVCGDLSDEEVIASDSKLSKLPGILNGRKLEDHRKVIAAKRAEINKELEKIPVRIDEAERGLPDVAGLEVDKLTAEINDLKAQIQAKEQEILRSQSGGEVAEKIKRLREIEGELLELKNEYRRKTDSLIDKKRQQLNEAKARVYSTEAEVNRKKQAISSNDKQITDYDVRLTRLREEWAKVDSETFVFSQDDTCPTCGQGLPQEQITAAREKALARFNTDKAIRLKEITATGKNLNSSIEELKGQNEALSTEIKGMEPLTNNNEIATLEAEITALQSKIQPIEVDSDYVAKMQEKSQVEAQIIDLQAGNQERLNQIQNEVTSLKAEVTELEKSLLLINQRKQGEIRIEELKKQEKALATEYEKLEGELFLTEEFIRSKVALLEQKINSKFKYARFKLFEVQVNGGVQETCQTTFNGVPYDSLNNAARINVGLDIINTLADQYKFYPAIFIDNAESINNIIPVKSQLINLTVSHDKYLRIEVAQ